VHSASNVRQRTGSDRVLDILHRQHAENGDRQDPAEDGCGSHAKAGEAEGEAVESSCCRLRLVE